MFIKIIVFVLIFLVVLYEGVIALIMDFRNPLPKFNNRDEKIDRVHIKKTRIIQCQNKLS